MITTEAAIAYARSLLGTPYSTYDCINFIKKIIRSAPGGVPGYTDAHVPALWDSYNSSGKYQHLIWQQIGITGAKPGMLAFKGQPLGHDHQPSHVGLVTSAKTVIHSSSTQGGIGVIETDLLNGQWTLLGKSKYIAVSDRDDGGGDDGGGSIVDILFKAEVTTERDPLRIRELPDGPVIGKAPKGATVNVLNTDDAKWWQIEYNGDIGYASNAYLTRIGDGSGTGSSAGYAGPEEAEPIEAETYPDSGSMTWGLFIPTLTQERAQALAEYFATGVVTQIEVND